MEMKPVVGVMGPGAPDEETMAMAEEVGRGVAERGGVLLCGGGGGAMEAAARGAAQAGGTVVGVLSGPDPAAANEYVTIRIATGMGNARNVVNVLSSDVVIAVRGSYGTLSEIALALKCGRPVVALQSWRLDRIGLDDELFHVAGSPAEAVRKAFELIT